MKLRNRLIRLLAITTLTAAGSAGVVAISETEARATSCATSCIGPVTVTTWPHKARFAFSTTAPAKTRVRIFSGDTLVTQAERTTLGTSHALETPAVLKADTAYTWRVRATDAAGNARVVSGTLRTKPVNCSASCIVGFAPSPKPASFSMTVLTTVPTKASVTVTQNGVFKAFAAQSTFSTSPKLQSANLLLPGTNYTATIKVTDQAGNWRTSTIAYKTQSRRVTVFVDEVFISSDSDPAGSGEIYGDVRLEGTERELFGISDLHDWDTVTPGVTLTAVNARATANFQVMLTDIDCISLCVKGLPTPWTTGTNDENDWATATYSIVAPDDFTSTGPIEFSAQVSSKVAFTVSGWYKVEYI